LKISALIIILPGNKYKTIHRNANYGNEEYYNSRGFSVHVKAQDAGHRAQGKEHRDKYR
jgi:hypothetical protein